MTNVANFTTTKGARKAQGGIKDIVDGRGDVFKVALENTVVRPGWNVRDENDPENIAHVDTIARSIADNGFRNVPLKGYFEDGKVVVTDGHTRRAGLVRAIEVYGYTGPKVLPFVLEPRGAKESDRVLTMILDNAGKPLSTLEKAVAYKRLIDAGLTVAQVAEKTGQTAVRVTQQIELTQIADNVLALVREGKVSSTFALETFKANGEDNDVTFAVLTDGLEAARSEGKEKVTKRFVGRPPRAKIVNEAGETVAAPVKPHLKTVVRETFAEVFEALGDENVSVVVGDHSFTIPADKLAQIKALIG